MTEDSKSPPPPPQSSEESKNTSESHSTPSAKGSEHDAKRPSPKSDRDLLNELLGLVVPMKKQLDRMEEDLSRLDKQTAILVEEKARAQAKRLFGEKHGERLLIHQVD